MALLLNAGDTVSRSYSYTQPSPLHPSQPEGTGERTGNLFDKSQPTTLTNKYLLSNGEESSNTSEWAASASIPVSGYYVTLTGVGGNLPSICAYDSSKQFVRGKNYGNSSRTTIDISECSYIRFSYVPSVQGNTAMLNYGSTPLPYEPYGYKIPISSANTTTPVYLGEVESTRRIKKLVLTGNENWVQQSRNQYDIVNYSLTVYGRNTNTRYIVCTHYKMQTTIIADTTSIGIYNGSNIFIRETYLDINNFKNYLRQQYAAGTPVTIWHVLANEKTAVVNEPIRKIGDYADEVSNVSIPVTAGGDTLSVGTTVQPSEVTVNYKGWHPVQSVHERNNGAWT